MFQKKVEAWPMTAWLAVAVSGPFALIAGRDDWLGVAIAAAITGALCWAVAGNPVQRLINSRLYCAVQYIFFIPVLAYFASQSSAAWPTGSAMPVVPLTLLSLAAAAACHGAQGASKTCSVLFWLIAGLYGVLLFFGSKDLRISFLQPGYQAPGSASVLALLLPAAMQFIPREIKPAHRLACGLVGAILVILCLWTVGGLSANVAAGMSWPLYEAGKSVSVLGIAERLESFISVAATVGFFALYSMLLAACGHMAEGIKPGWGKYGVILAGALVAALVLFAPQIPTVFLLFGALLLWCVVPFIGGSIFCEKKKKK